MGILDPTNSALGHGQLGLRSGLRTLSDLYGESACQKHVFADVYGAKSVASGWSVDSGSVYKATVNEVFDGRQLDVAKVYRSTEILTRVDSRAAVVAGTYYFDGAVAGATSLYVQLGDSSNPNTDGSVFMCFGFYFGNVSVVHPTLGPNKAVDGGFDVWTNPTTPTNWSVFGIGATSLSVNQESTIVYTGSYSARINATLAGGGYAWVQSNAAISVVSGVVYRVSGAYYYTGPGHVTPFLKLWDTSATAILPDGRNTVANASLSSLMTMSNAPYVGWQTYSFDFISFSSSVQPLLGFYAPTAAGGAVTIYFDNFKVQPVYRYEPYEQRFDIRGLPTFSKGRKTIHFDPWMIGTGDLRLQNGEAGTLETLFGQYEFSSQDLALYLGGRYQDGDEILIQDMKVERFVQQEPHVTDSGGTIPLRTPQTILEEVLPYRKYNNTDYPNVSNVDNARTRMLVFGNASLVRPARIDKSGTTGYGLYEAKDPLYSVSTDTPFNAALIALGGNFRTYLTEEDGNKDTIYRVVLDGASTTFINTAGQILTDVKPVWIKEGINNLFDFEKPAATPLVAVINSWAIGQNAIYAVNTYSNPPIGGSVGSLDAILQLAMVAQAAGATVTYSNTTHKMTCAYLGGPSFTIKLTSAAANAVKSGWRTYGFTDRNDKTAALTYTADSPLFNDVDADHIIRCQGQACSYYDDTSGTYTGVTGQIIQRAADVLYFIMNRVLNVATARINTADVVALRSGAFNLGVCIGGQSSNNLKFSEIVQRLEQSGLFDLVHDGDQWRFLARNNTTPSNITDIYDRDFIGEIDAYYNNDDIASTISVLYNYQQAGDRWASKETSPKVALSRRGLSPKPIDFKTWILADADATTRLTSFSTNLQSKRRRFRFTVKGVGMGLKPMDKIRINKTNYLGKAGDSNGQVVVRVLNKTDNWDTWTSEIEAAEVLSVTNGY